MNYEILRYSIVGESYNNENITISKEIHKLSVKRDEILEQLNEQNTTSSNTD